MGKQTLAVKITVTKKGCASGKPIWDLDIITPTAGETPAPGLPVPGGQVLCPQQSQSAWPHREPHRPPQVHTHVHPGPQRQSQLPDRRDHSSGLPGHFLRERKDEGGQIETILTAPHPSPPHTHTVTKRYNNNNHK